MTATNHSPLALAYAIVQETTTPDGEPMSYRLRLALQMLFDARPETIMDRLTMLNFAEYMLHGAGPEIAAALETGRTFVEAGDTASDVLPALGVALALCGPDLVITYRAVENVIASYFPDGDYVVRPFPHEASAA